MDIKLKLCGIKRSEDVKFLNEFPPDYAGFVFAKSRRQVTLEWAKSLSDKLSEGIRRVGVFVNQPIDTMPDFLGVINVFQLHGDENGDYIRRLRELIPSRFEIWKAVRVQTAEDISDAEKLGADRLLLDAFSKDAYGGTGITADWELIERADIDVPCFLAGGITADNLESAALRIKPYGIDLSGGIETDGVKDREKIKEVFDIIGRLNSR